MSTRYATRRIYYPWGKVPNYVYNPNVISVQNGRWSDPATWSNNTVPTTGDVVSIGHHVNYDASSTDVIKAIGVQSGASLQFRNDMNTKLTVITLMVFTGGYLEIGTTTNPIPANYTAQVVFGDAKFDDNFDPEWYGHGLIVFGKIRTCGAAKTPFVEVSAEMFTGDTTISLASAVSGWQNGDTIYIPDTRHLDWNEHASNYTGKWEEATLSSVASNYMTINLSSGLQFDHKGARNADNQALKFLPHVANIIRNVTFVSENPSGTRGYTIYIHRCDVDIRYTQFVALGRTLWGTPNSTTFDSDGHVTQFGTNQNGRWPVHFHHVNGPTTPQESGYQVTFIGNVIRDTEHPSTRTWFLVIHDTHYGLFQDNVIYNYGGAGVATMDGSESENKIDHNFVSLGTGTGERVDTMGQAGSGYWFRGFNNRFTRNITCTTTMDVYAYGQIIFGYFLGDCNFPNFQGADTSDPSQYTTKNGHVPVREWSDNIVYGATGGAFTMWWVNTPNDAIVLGEGGSPGGTIKNQIVWHVHNWITLGYAALNLTYDNLQARDDTSISSGSSPWGLQFADYSQRGVVIKNSDIQGFNPGIQCPGNSNGDFVIENCHFACISGISPNVTSFDTGGNTMPGKTMRINNCTFTNPHNNIQTNIVMNFDYPFAIAVTYGNIVKFSRVIVTDYNGVSGDNFQVYFDQQDPNAIMPTGNDGQHFGAPVDNLTNQECFDRFGICTCGDLMPAGAYERPHISGGKVVNF